MTMRTSLVGILTILGATSIYAYGCSSDSSGPSVACGSGTTLEGSTCVSSGGDGGPDATTITCGPGTTLKDGVCVVATATDGPTFAGVTTVTSTSSTTARLAWTAATDATTTADRMSYRIYVTQKTGTETYGSPQFTTLPGKTTFDVTGLEAGFAYFFVVRAVNSAAIEDTNVVEKSLTTSTDVTPPQFAGLLFADFVPPATGTGTIGQATLTWAAASDDQSGAGEIVYEVYESVTPDGENYAGAPKTSVTGAATATIDTVDYSISHYYVVLAKDKSGNRNPNKVERKVQKFPNLTDHIMPILVGVPGVPNSAKCAREGGCHIGATAPSGLAMDTVDNAYNNLVRANAAARYPVWTKDEMTADGGTPTTLTVDGGVVPMGNVSFSATAADIAPPFGSYSETQGVRVIPGFPLVSFMYQKITNTHKRSKPADPGNEVMPNPATTGATLTTEERERIRKWIAGGALKGPV